MYGMNYGQMNQGMGRACCPPVGGGVGVGIIAVAILILIALGVIF